MAKRAITGLASAALLLGLSTTAAAQVYYDWGTRTDRHGKKAGHFETTPVPLVETSTSYVLANDENPSGITFALGPITFVEGTLSSDCTTYDPVSRSCGAGTFPAYPTIAAAIAAVPVGNQTILVRQGTYSETGLSLKSGVDETHRWILSGYGQERPSITGVSADNDTIRAFGAVSFATVQRLRIQDNYRNGIRFSNDDTHIHVIDVWLYNNCAWDAATSGTHADGNLYFLGSDNNWIFHTTSEHTYGHGLKVGDDARGNIVEWSLVKDIGYWDGFPLTSYFNHSSTAIDFPNDPGDSDGDGVPDRGVDSIIRYNIVQTALYTGIQIRRCPNFSLHHNEVTDSPKFDAVDMSAKGVDRRQITIVSEDTYGEVYANVIHDPGSRDSAALGVSGCDQATPQQMVLRNNLFYGGERSSGALAYGGVESTGFDIRSSANLVVQIQNNSLYANSTTNLLFSGNGKGTGAELNILNNIFFQAGTGAVMSFNGFTPWAAHHHNIFYVPQGTVGLAPDATDRPDDPQWVAVPQGTYAPDQGALATGSPALDWGEDLSSSFTDSLNGATRPQGAGWDIGAYELPVGGPVEDAGPTFDVGPEGSLTESAVNPDSAAVDAPASDAAAAVDAGGGGDAGTLKDSMIQDGTTGDSSTPAGSTPSQAEDDGGCGCRQAARSPASSLWSFALAAALLALTRRTPGRRSGYRSPSARRVRPAGSRRSLTPCANGTPGASALSSHCFLPVAHKR